MLLPVALAAAGRDEGRLGTWQVAASPHRVENMTTHSLDRITGTFADGSRWSVFVKVLHPASESPLWASIPEEHRPQVLEELNWLDEPSVYRSGLADQMPAGLRLPQVFQVDEEPARITLWLEDVADPGQWDLDRYHRAAAALGWLSGSWPEERARALLGMRRRPLHGLFYGKIMNNDLPLLADDHLWRDPAVTGSAGRRCRAEVAELAVIVPKLLDRLEQLPHGIAHGDAAPNNLLEPQVGMTVAVDWSYGSCGPFGCDLAQLLAGRAESGAVEPTELPDIAATILDGYLDGLSEVGCHAAQPAIELAWATHLAVRSLFSCLLLERHDHLTQDARQELMARRASFARFGVDFVSRVVAEI